MAEKPPPEPNWSQAISGWPTCWLMKRVALGKRKYKSKKEKLNRKRRNVTKVCRLCFCVQKGKKTTNNKKRQRTRLKSPIGLKPAKRATAGQQAGARSLGRLR